jgi:hypothetical protein
MTHGGARQGSGRKRKYGEKQAQNTRPVNQPAEIPDSVYDRVTELIYIHGLEKVQKLLLQGFECK